MSHCKVSCCKALEANPETFSSRLPRNSSLRARNMFFCISCWNLKSTADVYNVTHIYIHYIIYNTYKYVYIYTVYIYTLFMHAGICANTCGMLRLWMALAPPCYALRLQCCKIPVLSIMKFSVIPPI